ncbi:hypothetical protein [Haloplanus salinarum]|uniref:hypothetical protein n=1 Tax=Haloplanus salinarum TaxID=1912324 RepID=UPI00214B95F5|nr:hypothetical protein [Haloplanus salinarum]
MKRGETKRYLKEGLFPGDSVIRRDEVRFLYEEIPDREIDRVTSSFDSNGKHVIVDEITVEYELDSLRPVERTHISKYVTEFSSGVVQVLLVGTVQEIFQAGNGHTRGERTISCKSAEEGKCWNRFFGVFHRIRHEIVTSVETHN